MSTSEVAARPIAGAPVLSDAPLKILIVLESSGGGSGRHVLDLAGGLATRGHDVTVVYSPVRAEAAFVRQLEALAGVASVPIAMQRAVTPADFRAYTELRRFVRKHGPFDVLHAHSSKAGALVRALPGPGARIYTPHAFRTMDPTTSRLSALVFGGIETALARIATDRVIAVSAEEARHARRRLVVPAEKLVTVVNGVSPPSLRPRPVVRSELGLKASEFVIGFVGRFSHQKHPQLYLRAIAEARAINPAIRGLMLGDGEQAAEVDALQASLGLGEAVSVIRGRSALDFFSAMDCLAITSRYEAMPYVLLEALSVGLPIISTHVGGVEEAVAPGHTGILAEADPQSIATAMAQVASNELLSRRLSAGAIERSAEYTTARMILATERVYFDVLSKARVDSTHSRKAA